MVDLLLKEGANPDAWGGHYGPAIQAAAYHGHVEVVKALIDAGARVHQGGLLKMPFMPPLRVAASRLSSYFLKGDSYLNLLHIVHFPSMHARWRLDLLYPIGIFYGPLPLVATSTITEHQ